MMVDDHAQDLEQMVEEQIRQRGISNARVLEAMRQVPRHRFIPKEQAAFAFMDGPLPIGSSQTISQPYIVALMTSLLQLEGDETVLEIGTGSGYQAAILSRLCRTVHTVEFIHPLAETSRKHLADLGYDNVQVHEGDGTLGWPDAAPYTGIMVTAAAPEVPGPLLKQLADGGRLVIPIGGRWGQTLQLWERSGEYTEHEDILPVVFVPLRGTHGWKAEEW